MAQIVWQTPAGSLGVIPETKIYRNSLVATDPDAGTVTYRVIAGTLPAGMQFSPAGLLTGTPYTVNENVVSRFTVRASTGAKIADRTFSLTVTGNNVPTWTTPAGSLGEYYEVTYFSYQFQWDDNDPGDAVVVRLAAGQLPSGLTLTPTGLLSGWLQPTPDLNAIPGYDITGSDNYPYDFRFQSINKNYQFTLEVTDGYNSDLRTFSVFVYSRQILTADTTVLTADNTFVTADQTPVVAPFIVNNVPSDLGTFRTDNYYAYQFIGEDYSGFAIKYALSVNEGFGLPPGLELDPNTGWYYGYIPDQGATTVPYSFNIIPYQAVYLGDPITCTGTVVGANVIVCNSTAQLKPTQPIVFTGSAFGGIIASETQIYYVKTVINATQFTVCLTPGSDVTVPLVQASGTMTANLILASTPTPFTLTLIGAVNAEIQWLTDSDLGAVINGSTSTLSVAAVNTGGRELQYRLKDGAYNLLPQGLELLPSGEIAGRISFDTFSLDLGATTFDETIQVTRNVTVLGTTFDLSFTFTVNAWAPETTENIYKVKSITVVNGGLGFNAGTPPVLTFNDPIGATAILPQTGTVTIVAGSITAVELADPGNGYTTSNPATLTVTQGFGGFGAELLPVMELSGTRDVVSDFKTFTVRLIRKYNKPYQNLLIRAMPPQSDRNTLATLLEDPEIFVPDWIYRYNDPNFGVAKNVTYLHATGLLPENIDTYISSLDLNHYRKLLTLGEIKTAQALDSAGNVQYEVVYSEIVDDLVNNNGVSVGKVVNLPYQVTDPADPLSTVSQVYPNSLQNMRDQVADVVGLISNDVPLPAWMTSTQSNGRVLGFTRAWVIAYTNPGRSKEIAYYISSKFDGHLNRIDFDVDRYILDAKLSRNWNNDGTYISGNNPPPGPEGNLAVGPGIWNPYPATLTTFDIYSVEPYKYIGPVDIATNLSFTDINGRTLADINAMGGFDGILQQVNGSSLIFVTQQNWNPPPGGYLVWSPDIAYPPTCIVTQGAYYYQAKHYVPAGIDLTDGAYWELVDEIDAGWEIQQPFDSLVRTSPDYYPLMSRTPNNIPAVWVNEIGYEITDITYEEEPYQYTETGVYVGSPDPLDGEPGSFDATPFSLTNIVPGGDKIECYQTFAATDLIACDHITDLLPGEEITFVSGLIGGIEGVTPVADLHVGQNYYIVDLGDTNWNSITGLTDQEFWVGQEITVIAQGSGTGTAQPIFVIKDLQTPNLFSISRTVNGATVALTDDTGYMIGNAANQRMGIWTINVDPVTTIVTLEFATQTNPNEYVTVTRGSQFTGAELYYPVAPGTDLTRVSWLAVAVVLAKQTTFDQNSMQFVDPVDMYDPTDRYDKYLVFPRTNILSEVAPVLNIHYWTNDNGTVVLWQNNLGEDVQWVN